MVGVFTPQDWPIPHCTVMAGEKSKSMPKGKEKERR
jgi:hypothetical protein